VQHLGLVHDGDLVSTRARVVETTERKGHKFVDLDVLIVNGDEEPVLRARHVAIYEPRTTRPT
jgi:acyl dehydratase